MHHQGETVFARLFTALMSAEEEVPAHENRGGIIFLPRD